MKVFTIATLITAVTLRALIGLETGAEVHAGRVAFDEAPAGPVDGHNRTFALRHSPDPPNSVRLLQGQVLGLTTYNFSYASGPNYCEDYNGLGPILCDVPGEYPLGSFVPPGLGQSYTDANFGSAVRIMATPVSNHDYSSVSAYSANSKYVLVWDRTANRHKILNAQTLEQVTETVTSGARDKRWDPLDDDIIWYIDCKWDSALQKTICQKIYRYSISQNTHTLVLDMGAGFYNLPNLGTGGDSNISKDRWWATLTDEGEIHKACAIDLVNAKAICSDYRVTHPDNRVPWDYVDGVRISKGKDSETGKRYVQVTALPGSAFYEVNEAAGTLDFIGKFAQDDALYSTGVKGNADGICDAGEPCLGSGHSDFLESQDGKQYIVINTGGDPCGMHIAALRFAAKNKIFVPDSAGGGNHRIMTIDYCGDVPWSYYHASCAMHEPYCAMEIYAMPPDFPTTVRTKSPFSGEIVVIKNMGEEIRRVAMHRSVPYEYFEQPRASISPDAKYVMWDTNFGVKGQRYVVAAATGYNNSNTVTPPPPTDTTAPLIFGVIATSTTASTSLISWTTNEAADSQVEYGIATTYGQSTSLNLSLITSHSVILSNLTAGKLYHCRVKSKDSAGNLAVSQDLTFSTAKAAEADTTPPVISALSASSITTTSATISFTTNEPATAITFYHPSGRVYLWNGLTTSFSQALPNLTPNTAYRYYALVKDAVGNTGISSKLTFTTLANVPAPGTTGGDTTAPAISNVVGVAGNKAMGIAWTTDEPGDSQVEYGLTTAYGSSTPLNSTLSVHHFVSVNGLQRLTTYNFRVRSKDRSGNLAISKNYAILTKDVSVAFAAATGVGDLVKFSDSPRVYIVGEDGLYGSAVRSARLLICAAARVLTVFDIPVTVNVRPTSAEHRADAPASVSVCRIRRGRNGVRYPEFSRWIRRPICTELFELAVEGRAADPKQSGGGSPIPCRDPERVAYRASFYLHEPEHWQCRRWLASAHRQRTMGCKSQPIVILELSREIRNVQQWARVERHHALNHVL